MTMPGPSDEQIPPALRRLTWILVLGSLAPALDTTIVTQAGPATSEWLLAASLLVRGAGLAGVTIAVMAGAFQGVPKEQVPDASSTTRIVLQVGGSFGAAVLAVILAHQLGHGAATAAGYARAFNTAFWWSIGFSVLALVPAFLLPGAAAEKTRSAAAAGHSAGRCSAHPVCVETPARAATSARDGCLDCHSPGRRGMKFSLFTPLCYFARRMSEKSREAAGMVAFVEPLTEHDPRQVGGFRLQARLGAGGMGRVYLGYSPGGRPVAVKVVHPDLARDPEFMQRFGREVAAAQAVSDAYTAAVVGAGPDDNPPWLATTYVPGPPLSDLVAQAGPLSEDAVWRLAGGLAEALQAIHAHGLVHRDLKPGNILIAADGPRVIDFGISRMTGGAGLTATRMTIGTPAYMSPEQAEGNPVGPASDVFSLGSVLAFAATGTAPFSGGEMFAVAYRVVHGDPDLSRVPVPLRPLIGACLAKNPAARPTPSELMRAVAATSPAYPEIAPGKFWPAPVSAVLESGEFAPGPLPPAPTPPAGPTPGPATHAAQPAQYSLTTTAAARRRRGPRWLLPAALGLAVAAGAGIAIALAVSPSPPPPSFLSTQTGTATASTASSSLATASSSPSATVGSSSATVGSSSSATAAASSAAAGSSSDNITVCIAPATNCTLAASMAERPRQIVLSADGSGAVSGLSWASWGGQQATGTGTLRVDDCQPNCASGKFAGYPATVTLSGLTPYGEEGSGLQAYSSIVVQAPSAPTKSYTFAQNTVPS
jgi:serine/threonine protein kinase